MSDADREAQPRPRHFSAALSHPRWQYIRLAGNACAVGWLLVLALALHPDVRSDAHTYWFSAQPGVEPYGRTWALESDAYVYSPPFLQLLTPIARALDWPAFHLVWTLMLFGGVIWLAGPLVAVILLLPIRGWPVWEALIWGNIEIPMAAALVVAQRRPVAWSFVLFTKVTPAVTLAWHVVRREWTAIGVVGIVSVAIFVASFALSPGMWTDWVAQLVRSHFHQPFAAPLWIRVMLAAVLAVSGGSTGRRWTIPVALVVAHPAIWYNTLAIPLLWGAAALRRRPSLQ